MTQHDDDEWDRPPNLDDLGSALDRGILERTKGSVSPAAKVAFDGALGINDLPRIHEHLAGIEIIAPHRVSPIEFMRNSGRDQANRLTDWEYLAGQRFRVDFDVVHGGGGTTNYDRMGLFDTDLARKHRAAGYSGKGAARVASTPGLSDGRLDAMQRRGAFAAQSRMSFWLAEAVIGYEIWPQSVSEALGEDVKYVRRRFREALHDLAGFYRLHATGPKHGRMGSWNDGDHPKVADAA